MINPGVEGRVAIITGGSGGIGKGVALVLAREGANVAICARRKAELEEAASEIGQATGRTILAVQADMTSTEDVQRLVSTVMARFGRIDILVYGANSVGEGGTFAQISDDAWKEHIDVKLLGCVRCVREVIPHMRSNQWGRIVIVSGMAARVIRPFAIDNGPICAGLSNFGKQVSNELVTHGIVINTVHPEAVKSPRMERRIEHMAKSQNATVAEVEKQVGRRFPGGQMIALDDVVGPIVFFCSQQAAGITGQSIAIDGGASPGIGY